MTDLIPRPCPFCGPAAPARLFAPANADPAALGRYAFASRKVPEYMHWRLMECGTCSVLYADPAPTAAALADLYREAAFDSPVEAGYASRTYARLLPRIAAALPSRGAALDVGTGDGAFLSELLRAGFKDAVGVEPSAAPVAAADPAVRPLIRSEAFAAGTFPAGSFDLVTCFQAIEHLPDPAGFCREVYRLLRPGGAIFLVGHNRRALSARLLGRKSPIFDIEHMQLFSRRSMGHMLAAAGFRRVRVRPFLNRYPLAYWARLFPLPTGMKRLALKWLGRSRLGRVAIPLPAGNLAAVGFKTA